jgi:hypothetical protein
MNLPDQIPTPRTDALILAPTGNYFSASATDYRNLARTLERETVLLRNALQAIRALNPTNMCGDYWGRNMGLEPDDVFDLCDAALAPKEVQS